VRKEIKQDTLKLRKGEKVQHPATTGRGTATTLEVKKSKRERTTPKIMESFQNGWGGHVGADVSRKRGLPKYDHKREKQEVIKKETLCLRKEG